MSKSNGYFVGFLFGSVRAVAIMVSLGTALLLSGSVIAATASAKTASTNMCADTEQYWGDWIVQQARSLANTKQTVGKVSGCARYVCVSFGHKTCGGNAIDLYKKFNGKGLVKPVISSGLPKGSVVFYGEPGSTKKCSGKWASNGTLKNNIESYGHVAIYTENGKIINVVNDAGEIKETSMYTLYNRLAKGGEDLTSCLMLGYMSARDFAQNF